MLEIRNLKKKYKLKEVLKGIDLTLKDGRIYGLVGLNGAGKSTLMKAVCSLVAPDEGEILFNGKNLEEARKKGETKLGFMIENPCFFENLTGCANLSVLKELYDGVSEYDVENAIKRVGLEKHGDVKVKKYSLGMKQRLYLAYAIMTEPNLLILDEPFNGIDPVSSLIFKNVLREYAKKGAAVLVSSHNLLDVQSVCDGLIILDAGKIVYENESIKGLDIEKTFFKYLNETEAQ